VASANSHRATKSEPSGVSAARFGLSPFGCPGMACHVEPASWLEKTLSATVETAAYIVVVGAPARLPRGSNRTNTMPTACER